MKNNLAKKQRLKTGGTTTLTTLVRDKKGHMLVKGTIHQDVQLQIQIYQTLRLQFHRNTREQKRSDRSWYKMNGGFQCFKFTLDGKIQTEKHQRKPGVKLQHRQSVCNHYLQQSESNRNKHVLLNSQGQLNTDHIPGHKSSITKCKRIKITTLIHQITMQ